MITILEYFEDTYRFSGNATVSEIGKDNLESYIILNQTLFYPQGGGQPSDQGTIQFGSESLAIDRVRMIDGVVYHYSKSETVPFHQGDTVTCKVNEELRLKHAVCHTAGHLLSHCLERIEPDVRAIKGYHFLDGPYVEFQGKIKKNEPELLELLNKMIKEEIQKNSIISVITPPHEDGGKEGSSKALRKIKIGSFQESACGGTHLRSLKEILEFSAIKIKKTKEGFKVSYRVA